MDRRSDSIILAARVLLSLLFIIDGVGKVAGYAAWQAYAQTKGIPLIEIGAPAAVAIELVGGLLVLFGGLTRPVVIVMAAYCLSTAYIGHAFWALADGGPRMNQTYHFWKNIGLCGAFLLLYVTGAGRYSIDALTKQKIRQAPAVR